MLMKNLSLGRGKAEPDLNIFMIWGGEADLEQAFVEVERMRNQKEITFHRWYVARKSVTSKASLRYHQHWAIRG